MPKGTPAASAIYISIINLGLNRFHLDVVTYIVNCRVLFFDKNEVCGSGSIQIANFKIQGVWPSLMVWYGIVGFNVPLDTIIGHFGDDFTGQWNMTQPTVSLSRLNVHWIVRCRVATSFNPQRSIMFSWEVLKGQSQIWATAVPGTKFVPHPGDTTNTNSGRHTTTVGAKSPDPSGNSRTAEATSIWPCVNVWHNFIW